MVHTPLDIIAPHYCCGCGKIGDLLCPSCINDIVTEPFELCAACSFRAAGTSGLCTDCRPPYVRAFVIGDYEGALGGIIGELKFSAARSATKTLARLAKECLPALPAGAVLVPVPTIRKHVRERGFDHMRLIVRYMAKQFGVRMDATVLKRNTNTVQRGASAAQRKAQARQAFVAKRDLNPDVTYILVDDVMTTGATLMEAARLLREAGATKVWVIVFARQVLS